MNDLRRSDRTKATTDEDPRSVDEVRLRDGTRMWVRPIRPTDRTRIEEGLQLLSPRSRYLRFHSAVQRLSSSQLAYLTEVDHHDHEALIALDPDLEGAPGIGVARYIRLAEDPTIAEAAITVLDDYQGRGIGTTLLGKLEPLAWERGIRTFRNYVLAENKAMLEIFAQLDGTFVREEAGLYRVDVPIPEPDSEQPDTPAGQWIASVARSQPADMHAWAYPFGWLVERADDAVRQPLRMIRRIVEEGAERVDEVLKDRALKNRASGADAEEASVEDGLPDDDLSPDATPSGDQHRRAEDRPDDVSADLSADGGSADDDGQNSVSVIS
ncbi:GNAT family N-acetyltransferase [Euzebya pacifica]|jgi:GNAT superfamily N-acetyltransferase|uniref:GNAT family N-acetyltransferase n=1 Tax=Euzebya pacifica TaxID=1608957 RepID=UPI0030F8C206